MKVGKKLVDAGKSLNFAVSNADDFRGELDEYGLSYGSTPVVAVRDEKNKKFIMSEEFRLVCWLVFSFLFVITDMLFIAFCLHVSSLL